VVQGELVGPVELEAQAASVVRGELVAVRDPPLSAERTGVQDHPLGHTILPTQNLTVREVLVEQSRYFPRPARCQQMQRWEPAP
jgi:hypothetical protein